MNPSGEERDEGGHAPAHMDTRLNPSGQVPSCPSPGASPTTPRPITELDRLTGRRSWPLLRPREILDRRFRIGLRTGPTTSTLFHRSVPLIQDFFR
jgi:hypothetical protein